MVSMRMTGAPRCFRASGCTSRSSHRCSAAIMSQVTIGGGDRATCGLRADADELHRRGRAAFGCLRGSGRSGTATTWQALEQDGAAGAAPARCPVATSSRGGRRLGRPCPAATPATAPLDGRRRRRSGCRRQPRRRARPAAPKHLGWRARNTAAAVARHLPLIKMYPSVSPRSRRNAPHRRPGVSLTRNCHI